MPLPLTTQDQVLLNIGTRKAADLAAMSSKSGARYPFPLPDLIQQVTTGRLDLATENLRDGDDLLISSRYRSSIARYYYAMYNGARAIVFAHIKGDDHQHHSDLPAHLPSDLDDRALREQELTDAHFLRNRADYDPFPTAAAIWEGEARDLSLVASTFLQSCLDYAVDKNLI